MRRHNVYNDQNELIIPDCWPGSVDGNVRHLKDVHYGVEHYLNKWQMLNFGNVHKVLLACDDNYTANGVRNVLSEVDNIHLKTLSEKGKVQAESNVFSPDVIIWGMNSFLDLCEHIDNIMRIRRVSNKITQIIVCDDLPKKIVGKDALIKGLTLVSGRMAITQVRHLIKVSLADKEKKSFSIAKILSPRQFEVLDAYANGLTTKKIAMKYKINLKTVLTHKYQAFNALGINDRNQKALFTRAIGRFSKSLQIYKHAF